MFYDEILKAMQTNGNKILSDVASGITTTITNAAINTLDSVEKEVIKTTQEATDALHAAAALSALSMAELALDSGIDTLDVLVKNISPLISTLQEGFHQLRKNGDVAGVGEGQKAIAELAGLLHSRINDLSKACFEQKNITIGQFKNDLRETINQARPELEKHLETDFVKLLLNPILDFLKGMGLTRFVGFFEKKPEIQATPDPIIYSL